MLREKEVSAQPRLKRVREKDGNPHTRGIMGWVMSEGWGWGKGCALGLKARATGSFPHQEGNTSGRRGSHEAREMNLVWDTWTFRSSRATQAEMFRRTDDVTEGQGQTL